ncbi:unnamed protein product [Leuciscus chuanchicus]
MHRHHCHPLEVNEERIRLLKTKRKAWDEDEDLMLYEIADREWKESMMKKDHLIVLSALLPHRSKEALRKRLQGLKWEPPGTIREVMITASTSASLEMGAAGDQNVAHPPMASNLPVPKQGKVWSQEEDHELLEQAGRIWREGMLKKDLVTSLQPFFIHRSLEAIRNRVQKLGWPTKETSVEVERRDRATSINPDEVPRRSYSTQPSSLPLGDQQLSMVQWRREILAGIRDQLREPGVGAKELGPMVEDLLEDRILIQKASEFVEDYDQEGLRKKKPVSNRQRRRLQYAYIQRMYRTKRRDAASVILEGCWKYAYLGTTVTVEHLEDFWANTMEVGSEEECQEVAEAANVHWPILAPIEVDEVTTVLRGLVHSAVGMDKISAKELLAWHQPSLASFMNIMLATESLPSTLARARVTFIPKTDTPK